MGSLLAGLNDGLKELGIPAMGLVAPDECRAQKKNARYMNPQTFARLVANVKKDGRLESVPLVWRAEDGGIEIISGHHRIAAAKEAGLERIVVMFANAATRDEVVARQLSHNAIVGQDDLALLKELYDGLGDLTAKFYTGLSDELEKFSTVGISFRPGTFTEFVVAFGPEEVEKFDDLVAEVKERMKAGSDSVIRASRTEEEEPFLRAIRSVKRAENIKSNGTALARIVQLAKMKLDELQAEGKPLPEPKTPKNGRGKTAK